MQYTALTWTLLRTLAVLALVLAGQVSAQNERLAFHHMPVDYGLSQNTVTDMLQDSRGFMWFGTMNGVNRFDGNRFTAFPRDPRKPNHLKPIWVADLLEDKGGDIWVAGSPGILERINIADGSVTRFGPSLQAVGVEEVPQIGAYTLGRTADGTIWFASQEGLFYRSPGDSGFQQRAIDNNDELGAITHLLADSENQLLVTSSTGLWRLPANARAAEKLAEPPSAIQSSLAASGFTTVLRDAGGLWLGGADGLYRMQPGERPRPIRRSLNGHEESLRQAVMALLIDEEGTLWAGTDGGGLLRYDRSADAVEVHVRSPDNPRSLGMNDVWSLYEDRSGLIWIGMAGAGLNQINPSRHRFGRLRSVPFNDNSLSHNFVWDFAEDGAGNIWIATLNGLDRYQPQQGQFTRFPLPREVVGSAPSAQEIQSVTVDQNDQVWIGSVNGHLFRLNPDTGEFINVPSPDGQSEAFTTNRVWALFPTPNQQIGVSTSAGNFLIDPNSFAITRLDFGFSTSDANSAVRSMAITTDHIWLGFNGQGLVRFTPATGEVMHFQPDPDQSGRLSYGIVRALHLDEHGGLWAGTLNGLNYLADAENATPASAFRLYTPTDGLPDNTIYGILPGGEDQLWLSTNLGLSLLDTNSGEFRNFGVEDGLSSREFNGGADLRSRSGVIYFGTVSGVTVVRPDELTRNSHPPPVAFTELNVGHRPWFEQGQFVAQTSLVLPYDENDLAFGFAALDFHQPSKNRFQYRLLGLTDEWVETEANNATYTSLAPGHYTLEVMASNNDGVWNPEPARFDFTIAAPPWRTTWAYLLYATLLVLLVWSYQRRQAARLRQANEFNRQLRHAHDLAEANHELAIHNARYDRVTRLPNRQHLLESITEHMAGHAGSDQFVALLIINLDRFRQINDNLGIQAGDQVLEQIADRMEAAVAGKGLLARLGSDEFALLVGKHSATGELDELSDTVLKAISQTIRLPSSAITPSASIGVALYPQDARSRSDLMRFADLALDRAKADGGNQVRHFDASMIEATRSRFRIEERLRNALESNELSLYYQPIVDARSGQVRYSEALLRWFPPDEEPIFPDQFIPVAEDTGLIVPIGEWVLDQAAQQLSALRRSGVNGFRLTVNLSMRQLRDDARLERAIESVIERHALRPGDLELEITETAMMDNLADAVRMFARLRDLGCSMAIDDFGTGYSSLNYLRQLPVDKLKIDRSFVTDLESNEQSRRLVMSIIRLAHELELDVVAEGVETLEAGRMLREMGCEYLQGYYFSRPQPVEKLAEQAQRRYYELGQNPQPSHKASLHNL